VRSFITADDSGSISLSDITLEGTPTVGDSEALIDFDVQSAETGLYDIKVIDKDRNIIVGTTRGSLGNGGVEISLEEKPGSGTRIQNNSS
jgi:hypothetical protein